MARPLLLRDPYQMGCDLLSPGRIRATIVARETLGI